MLLIRIRESDRSHKTERSAALSKITRSYQRFAERHTMDKINTLDAADVKYFFFLSFPV